MPGAAPTRKRASGQPFLSAGAGDTLLKAKLVRYLWCLTKAATRERWDAVPLWVRTAGAMGSFQSGRQRRRSTWCARTGHTIPTRMLPHFRCTSSQVASKILAWRLTARPRQVQCNERSAAHRIVHEREKREATKTAQWQTRVAS